MRHGWTDLKKIETDCLGGTICLTQIKLWFCNFRVPPGLCFKTRVGAQPLIWKPFFIFMQIKLIFTRKVVHLVSF